MDIGQQFMGPLSEMVHMTNKLLIVQEEGSRRANGNVLGGGGVGASIGGALLGATGLSAAVNAGQRFAISGKKFEVQINPEKYERKYTIVYTTPSPINGVAQTPQFSKIGQGKLNVTFTLDGTGVIPPSITDPVNFAFQTVGKLAGITDVSYVTRRIQELKETIGDYNQERHEPPIVKVIWGDETPFKGRMEDLTITYTLFHPSGVPLRAEVVINFMEYRDVPVRPASPDLTHRRTVTQYDTLPLMTEVIYDPSYTWQVALANNLTHYRRLRVGDTLYFPPLERQLLRS